MTSFLPNSPASTDQPAPNLAWWPAISTAPFRAAYRVRDDVPDDQVLRALRDSVLQVNAELSEWQTEQAALGYLSLENVPAASYGADTELVLRYRAAVHGYAKARLMDSRRDTDTTADGHDRADALESTADDHRADALRHLRAITGQGATTVELI